MAKRTVLIVDDEEGIRKMLAEMLALEGYSYESASGGAEALAVLERGDPRVVLLDLRMEPVAGWDVMQSLQAKGIRDKHTIIFVSADAKLEEFRHLGPDGELAKPFTLPELMDVLERHAA